MPDNKLAPCSRRFGVFERYHRSTNRWQRKIIGFRCGRSSCPYCRELRRKRLIRRLHLASWPDTVYLWTITTDPKILDPEEALKTLNRRWHIAHRTLQRLAPGLKFFRVVELTKSGLPHMHLICDRFIPWKPFQSALMRADFGKVLHFSRVPKRILFGYVTKYVSKTLPQLPTLPYRLFRIWSASRGLLPAITYHDPDGAWTLVSCHGSLWYAESMEHSLELHHRDKPPP